MQQNTPPTQPPQNTHPLTEPQAADATQAARPPQKKEITLLTEPTRQILAILLPIAGLFLILWAEMADNRRATESQIAELRRTTEAQITELRTALQAQIDELRRTNENIRIELAKITTILRLGNHYQGSNETAAKTEPTPPSPETPAEPTPPPQAAINPAPPSDATSAPPSTGTS